MHGRREIPIAHEHVGRPARSAHGGQASRYATPIQHEGSHAAMNPSARMIIELNIAHFRDLLTKEQDTHKRTVISGLLREEERKLLTLNRKETD